MKVLNISNDDYANFSFNNAKALRAVGINAVSVKSRKHLFKYAEECQLLSVDQIKRQIDSADIVQLMHSDQRFLQYCIVRNKKIYVYHTGTAYRQNPVELNQVFNPYVRAAFTDQCEFIGLGMKNEQYIATSVDTDKFAPNGWQVHHPYTVAHYPSNPAVKGTNKIHDMLDRIKNKKFLFNYSAAKVSHENQICRMQNCDIYIELFAPTQGGKPYGCFGVTAFEAASLGKIVVTNNIRQQIYHEAYGRTHFYIANTETDFIHSVEYLLGLEETELRRMQEETRQWIIDKHSFKNTGQRLKNLLNI